MIRLAIYGEDFEHEIKPLVRAFYPEEKIVASVMPLTDYRTSDDHHTNEEGHISEGDHVSEGYYASYGRHANKAVISTETSLDIKLVLCRNNYKIYIDDILAGHGGVATYDRKSYRDGLARRIYDILSVKTGKALPWGILTGVRPVKLIYGMLESGMNDEDVVRHMEGHYYADERKSRKGIVIARREMEVLNEIDYRNGYSLYIGIPFCPTTCAYCSFASFPLERNISYVGPYLKALHKEIHETKDMMGVKKLDTVYIGGGTPTTLTDEQLDGLLCQVSRYFNINEAREFCIEAGRPDSITRDKLIIMKSYGVNRISINPQSMNEETLKVIGRNHDAKQTEHAFHLAREEGYDNINMDMIIGLPGESPRDVQHTLDALARMNPDGLTIHTLAVKRAARLNTHKELYADKASGIDEMYLMTEEHTRLHGYFPYYLYRQKNMSNNLENIGYSRHGKEGIYNMLVMEEKQDVLALGAAAMSKRVPGGQGKIERVENVKSLDDYIGRIDEMVSRKAGLFAQI